MIAGVHVGRRLMPGPPRAAGRPGGGPRARLALLLALLAAVAVVGCAGGVTPPPTYPPQGSSPQPAGAAAEATSRQVIAALGARSIATRPADTPYRPPEGPRFAAAPRDVLHAEIPGDAAHGFIVVYEFATGNEALAAATEEATYVSSGPGRVQFVPDTQFVLRVVDATAIFYAWAPSSSPDAAAKTIGDTLATLGSRVAVPR